MTTSELSQDTGPVRGRVIAAHGRTFIVLCGGREIECELRGKLKQGNRNSRAPVAVGDWVSVAITQGVATTQPEGGAIAEVEARRTVFSRPSPHNPRLRQLIASNVDQLLIFLAVDDLLPQLELLDRLIVAARTSELEPVIFINKTDLASDPERVEQILAPYRAAGYRVHFTAIGKAQGLEVLREVTRGRTTVIAGPSGAGKTTALNALCPGEGFVTGAVKASGKGRHTTTAVRLVAIGEGSYLVDTPGVKEFAIEEVLPGELGLWYPEFLALLDKCKYSGCTHTHEPHCAIKQAVAQGRIDNGRYLRYCRIAGCTA